MGVFVLFVQRLAMVEGVFEEGILTGGSEESGGNLTKSADQVVGGRGVCAWWVSRVRLRWIEGGQSSGFLCRLVTVKSIPTTDGFADGCAGLCGLLAAGVEEGEESGRKSFEPWEWGGKRGGRAFFSWLLEPGRGDSANRDAQATWLHKHLALWAACTANAIYAQDTCCTVPSPYLPYLTYAPCLMCPCLTLCPKPRGLNLRHPSFHPRPR